jgi:hypothetical protein
MLALGEQAGHGDPKEFLKGVEDFALVKHNIFGENPPKNIHQRHNFQEGGGQTPPYPTSS